MSVNIPKIKTKYVAGQIYLANDVSTHAATTNAIIDALDNIDTTVNTAVSHITTIDNNINALDSSMKSVVGKITTIDSSVKKLEDIIEDLNPDTSNKMDKDASNYEGGKELPDIIFQNCGWKLDTSIGEVDIPNKDMLDWEHVVALPGDSALFWGEFTIDSENVVKEGKLMPTNTEGTWGVSIPISRDYSDYYETEEQITTDTSIYQTISANVSELFSSEDGRVYYKTQKLSKTKSIGIHFNYPYYYGFSEVEVTCNDDVGLIMQAFEAEELDAHLEYTMPDELELNLKRKEDDTYEKYGVKKYFYILLPSEKTLEKTTIGNNIYNDWVEFIGELVINGKNKLYKVYRSKYLQTANELTINIKITSNKNN